VKVPYDTTAGGVHRAHGLCSLAHREDVLEEVFEAQTVVVGDGNMDVYVVVSPARRELKQRVGHAMPLK
jgi:hypothetical protein